jgi:4-amino-4-deoxy-L-arabinose transferase-like glycosyltransferase
LPSSPATSPPLREQGPAADGLPHSHPYQEVGMDAASTRSPLSLSPGRCRALAACLILAAAAARIVFFLFDHRLDLAPDEAHYWDWSRHLDWSYYSKGGGVAWLIRLGCTLFGKASIWLTGTETLAVRLPAIICGSLLVASLYTLTVRVTGKAAMGLAVAAIALTTPVVAAGSSLMTIDSPYTCCWGWALVWMYDAIFRQRQAGWWLAGMATGLGILAKYTMILFLPSVGLYLLFSPHDRRLLLSRGFWIFVGLAALSCTPIVAWNMQHEWVSFRHVQALSNVEESGIHWLGPIKYVAVQCGLWLVFWFIVWARGMVELGPWRRPERSLHYLWWMSLPMFAVFLAFSFKTDGGEPNWPVTAYMSGLVLGVIWMAEELRTGRTWSRVTTACGLGITIAVGLLLTAAIHCSAAIHPLLTELAGPPTPANPFPLRRFDPTLRLSGWRHLAGEVDRHRRALEAEHVEPIIAATGWNLPGLIGFYCEGHPAVYSLGPALGDRRSQYDFWRPNPISDTSQFLGKTFLVIAPMCSDLHGAFDQIEQYPVIHFDSGQPVAGWVVLVCRGFRGFPSASRSGF